MSTVIIDWIFKERPVIKPRPDVMWLDRMMTAVASEPKFVPWVTKYEIKAWCAENDYKFSRAQVELFCNDNGLKIHSWGPGCVYFKKAEAL